MTDDMTGETDPNGTGTGSLGPADVGDDIETGDSGGGDSITGDGRDTAGGDSGRGDSASGDGDGARVGVGVGVDSGRGDRRPVLEVRGLTVDFDGFRALDDVDLTVAEGELRFLIGPNGAGKTTLVDVITGLTRATAGDVRFAGTSITRSREHRIVRMGIGRSFQTPTVFDSLTVAENLDLAESFRRPLVRLLRRARLASDAVAATLDDIGLAAVATRPAGELSHGQKQWLEIGMLLVQDPKLLLLDEPVAGMSPQERLDTGALIQRLAGERTVVVIEHDMAFLRRFAHTVTVLHEGRILCEGSVAEVQADPRVREVYLGRSRDERSGALAVDPADVEVEA